MKFIKGTPRDQLALFSTCLDDAIDDKNEVRLIDVFVGSLDLEKYGFKVHFPENGRPAYHPGDLLRLFIYGYLNRIRSSRSLEKECHRNIEVMWLLQSLSPDHNTIANFRKDNPKAIKKVFRATVQLARNLDLIGGALLAGDSTKMRAQNSKKNNYNSKKIKRHLEYIDRKLDEYQKQMDQADNEQGKQEPEKGIKRQKTRRKKYKKLKKQLRESGQEQISTSDPQSRHMIIRNNITEVAYNIQSSVDAKYFLPIDYQVTAANDSKAMGPMLQRAKTILGNANFTALFDKGYHTGSEIKTALRLGITPMVAIPAPASNAPDKAYNSQNFVYDDKADTYTCPEGNTLTTNGSVYTKHRGKSNET